ncbi:MAG: phosphoribosylformylglycinamidine synthase subunit PurQ, partial [Nostocales cyanobacterium W4_Combined_metabat2_030]|nr:phosphoribosylformylglycinamidine synthase subunit PurQ [Nostocales cyanobacterium W4_Combined_metabat2_030]
GAIARFSPVMQQVIDHALKGKFVIGICNGFQVLTEAGLLPGALARNQDLHFICDRSSLKVERNNLPWTYGYTEGEVITLPIAHGEGRFYSDESTLAEIEANGQVLFRYQENPNGSLNDIAGICNLQGNVLGMMPHPERAADKALGNSDGLRLFQGLLERVGAVV